MERRPQSATANDELQEQQSTSHGPTTRSSARVRAAQKQREQPQQADDLDTSPNHPITRSSSGRNRNVSNASATKTTRPRRSIGSTSSGVVINEPVPDRKGKKRAAPEPDSSSEDDEFKKPSTSSQPAKHARVTRSTSNLRPNATSASSSSKTNPTPMPRKPRASTSSNAAAAKSRSVRTRTSLRRSSPGNDSGESDIDMVDAELYSEGENPTNTGQTTNNEDDSEDKETQEKKRLDAELPGPFALDPASSEVSNSAPVDESSPAAGGANPPESMAGGSSGNDAAAAAVAGLSASAQNLLNALSGDETSAAALSMFSSDFRSLSAHIMGHSSKLKGYLESIKLTADPLVRYSALQELNELLVMSNEDTLSGYFQVDSFTKALIAILGGKRNGGDEEDDEDHDNDDEQDQEEDEDAALAAALAMSTGAGAFQGDENPEAQVLASRCLYNMMEALPGTAHTVVFHGAIPALCSKLLEIQFIDLAEQNISTLDKISEECANSVARQGGLPALLNFLDFFNTSVQRTAMHAAANCCRSAGSDIFPTIKEILPIIQNVLNYPDQRLVESAAQCVIRLIESYHRFPDMLDELLTQNDMSLIRAINNVLLPGGGGTPLITSGTYTGLLRSLSNAAKASTKAAIALLEADFSSTLYQIMTGVLPPSNLAGPSQTSDQPHVVGGSVADMAMMQSLAHRPKEQVEEALSLISELMPPLPKDGVFNHHSYTEKALAKMQKHKAKAERHAARAARAAARATTVPEREGDPQASGEASSSTPDESAVVDAAGPHDSDNANGGLEGILPGMMSIRGDSPESGAIGNNGSQQPDSSSSGADTGRPNPATLAHTTRTELLRGKQEVLMRFMKLMTPVLVEVYAASVAFVIRTRALTGLLKVASFLEGDDLWKVVEPVPLASFIGSILSSRDHQILLVNALQLVELLVSKLPSQYRNAFRREGVLHEITTIGDQDLTTKVKVEPPSSTSNTPIPDDGSIPPPTAPLAQPSMTSATMGSLRRSTQYLDPQDATILRARIINFKYLSTDSEDADGGADADLHILKTSSEQLSKTDLTLEAAKEPLKVIAGIFGRPNSPMSSFEMLQSGAVEGLLAFATDVDRPTSVKARQNLILDILGTRGSPFSSSTPLSVLVKRLQESLTRMESFDVVTVSPGGDDSRRNSTSMLARQLRLRLVGEGSDIPKNCNNITVSIHAIATLQALHDYLRPRVATQGLPTNSRISGMLAAFAAAAGLPPGSLPRPPSSIAGQSASTTASGTSTSAPSTTTSTDAASPSETKGGLGGSSSALDAADSASDSSDKEKGPRRSRRISMKLNGATATAIATASSSAASGSTSTSKSAPATPQTTPKGTGSKTPTNTLQPPPKIETPDAMDLDDDSYVNADVDAEMLEQSQEDNPKDEKTVTLAVADDGDKVVAQTPEGTRVATPTPQRDALSAEAARGSYASALKMKPIDWHLEFSLEGHPISLETTVYGAIHQHEARKSSKPSPNLSSIWSSLYTVKFKKVSGPSPVPGSPVDATVSAPPAVSEDSSQSRILRLLRVLHTVNDVAKDREIVGATAEVLPDSAFINNKLTAKLSRQLEEPMIVASACLPDWAVHLPQHYPFLFPFSTRFSFLQSTSFGYARLINKWQSQQSRSNESSRRDDTFGYLGRLQRQKVRISRKHLLESAIKVLELYGSSSSVLEVEYFEEVGTGLGPTLEFYSLVSREFARRDIKMWHDLDATVGGTYVHHPTGLYPAPFNASEAAKEGSSSKKRSDLFRLLGQFVAKALLDSRIIDLSFNRTFLKLIMGEEITRSVDTLMDVDPALATSLRRIQQYIAAQKDVENDVSLSAKVRESLLESITINDATLEDLALDFTLPGYEIELIPGGADVTVDHRNVQRYIDRVLDVMLEEGVRIPVNAFREGFSRVFPIHDLQPFSSEEMLHIFGSANEDWSIETLSDSVKADHGFNTDSRAFRDLVQVMTAFDNQSRREFLQFITGSPKLPIGGFRGLNPPLTVVRKPHEAPLSPDDYLPSVMTCVNYLKLPDYSSRAVMAAKLRTAMKEGGGSFHLS